uniref:Methyltransferase, FkbM family n=1 Tax=Candidatus Kentrum sp. DK TaxID=2126562 RepID=A0A450RVL6_9GAMM|nr:MAG: methyltransferase, FkbM family [Candidatus Kentron sp. DK]
MIILYLPIVTKKDQLIDLLSRAAWFLTFCPIGRLYVLVDSEQLTRTVWRVAPGMDGKIEKNFEKLRKIISFVVVSNEHDLQPYIDKANIILRWKKDACPNFMSGDVLESWLNEKRVWEVDPSAVRLEGSYYIEVGLSLTNKLALIKKNQNQFKQLASKLGKFKRAYILATGPTVSNYKKYDFHDSLSVICNTVILDDELMRVVRPQILVFADPIFHFGPSQYAGTFRKSLVASAQKYSFTICIPFKYYGLFVSAVPELANRTIGIPYTKDRDWNFSLEKDLELRATANILTFLMVPLAGTFANEIRFLGCDGRPFDENSYFWGHNEKTQINDKMENIQQVHPGFFAINYNDYYLEHCKTLEDQLIFGEELGLKFYSLADSYIPAMKSRVVANLLQQAESLELISLNPDAESGFGHFVNYERNLRRSLHKLGMRHVILGPLAADVDTCREFPDMIKLFSIRSHILHGEDVGVEQRVDHQFVRLAQEYLAERNGIHDRMVFMYCGSLEVAYGLRKVALQFPETVFHVNLFYLSCVDISKPVFINLWKDKLHSIYDIKNIRLYCPTDELSIELFSVFGVRLPVLSHPSTTYYDDELPKVMRNNSLVKNVLYLGNLRAGKGCQLTRLSISKLLELCGNECIIKVRRPPQGKETKEIKSFFESVNKRVEVIDGNIGKQEFKRIIEEADVMVLPYTPDKFRNRTSGLLIDGLYAGIPCVVLENTWLSSIVMTYKHGLVCAPNEDAILQSIINILNNYESFQNSALESRYAYLRKNSWDSLAKQLCESKFVDDEHLNSESANSALRIPKPMLIEERYKIAKERKKMLIIGNGPSARLLSEMGFHSIPADFDTFGTTCAFRYFERIGWWPTYYGLADRKVVFHHREKFNQLLTDLSVTTKKFFLSWQVSNSERLEVIPHSSTGSFCLMKSIELGYNEIYLIGVEGSYVEEITESRALTHEEISALGFDVLGLTKAESKLRIITKTPSFNPNYFCDDYQIEGDVYSLPQAHMHQRNWSVIARDAAAANINVFNLSPISRISVFERLNITTVFPQVQNILTDLPTPSIFGPFTRHSRIHWNETEGVFVFLRNCLCDGVMIDVGAHRGSAFGSFLDQGWRIFAFEPDEKNRAKLLERLAKHKNNTLVLLDTRCVSNKSQNGIPFYRSSQSTSISSLSAFHESHIEAQRVDTITLTEFFEDKPLPTVDFLKIDTEGHDLFVLQGFPWDRTKPAIIECEFEDSKTVPLGYTFHDLAGFLVEKGYTIYVSEWHPIIRYGIRHDWRCLKRYPCELEDVKAWGNLLAFRDPIDEQALIAAVRKVLKVGADNTAKPKPISDIAKGAPNAIDPDRSKKPPNNTIRIISGPHYKRLATGLWCYTHSDAPQRFWMAVFEGILPSAGREYSGGLRLTSNSIATIRVTLARHGATEYEGASREIRLMPGEGQTIRLTHAFTNPHGAIRIQVEVIELEGGNTADFGIDALWINESLTSIGSRLGNDNIDLPSDLSRANRLFREGDYRMAMGLYLLLHRQRPMKMYHDNAMMSARRLGMNWLTSVDELVEMVS